MNITIYEGALAFPRLPFYFFLSLMGARLSKIRPSHLRGYHHRSYVAAQCAQCRYAQLDRRLVARTECQGYARMHSACGAPLVCVLVGSRAYIRDGNGRYRAVLLQYFCEIARD